MPASFSPVIQNRRARHDYFVRDSMEAGIELRGCEVKSIRLGNASLAESYAQIDANDELWVVGMHVSPYRQGGTENPDPNRKRRLLMRKQEIRRLRRHVEQKGVTLVPLRLYFQRGLAKIELGLCTGKHTYDKREAIKERDLELDARREMSARNRDR
jgi:SsrA-binding protein